MICDSIWNLMQRRQTVLQSKIDQILTQIFIQTCSTRRICSEFIIFFYRTESFFLAADNCGRGWYRHLSAVALHSSGAALTLFEEKLDLSIFKQSKRLKFYFIKQLEAFNLKNVSCLCKVPKQERTTDWLWQNYRRQWWAMWMLCHIKEK